MQSHTYRPQDQRRVDDLLSEAQESEGESATRKAPLGSTLVPAFGCLEEKVNSKVALLDSQGVQVWQVVGGKAAQCRPGIQRGVGGSGP